MGTATKQQIGKIYAIGNALGIVVRGTHDDDLHALVETLTGKASVAKLAEPEAAAVIAELERRQGSHHPTPTAQSQPRERYSQVPGGITKDQQRKVWALMYQLRDLDATPSTATLGERLCGIIRKDLQQDTTPENPFSWITFQAGRKLIEALKKYVANARRKAGDTT